MGCVVCKNVASPKSGTNIIIGDNTGGFLTEKSNNLSPDKNSPSMIATRVPPPTKSLMDSRLASELPSIKNLSDYFPSTTMLKEINQARTDPLSYIPKIESFRGHIINDNENNYFLNLDFNNFDVNLRLNRGKIVFDNCILFLKNLAQKKKLEPLIMNENLKIPFPTQNPKLCIDKEYIKNIILFKSGELEGKMSLIDFHYDVCVPSPEISTIMQIIDDTNSNFQRRKNIFNHKAKYIGITEGLIKPNMSCYYLMFAE